MTVSIASIGECMLELSGQGADWRMGHAGDTFNTLWTMRALLPAEDRTDYVSGFGDDPFSAAQLDFMAEAGIGTAASPRIAGARPGLYAITLTGAERSFTYWRSDAAARRLADDPALLAESLAGRDLVYCSGITLAILEPKPRGVLLAALAAARSQGACIAFDPNYRPRLWPSAEAARQAVEQALTVADIVLPTLPDERALFGDASPQHSVERLRRAGVGEIVVKDGENPTLLQWDGASDEVAAERVSDAVDTTGAGDAFNGAYLAQRAQGVEPAEAVRLAHRVAAAVIRVRGALAPAEAIRRAAEADPGRA